MNIYTQIEDGLFNGTLKALVEYFPAQDDDSPIVFSHNDVAEPDSPYVVINVLNIDQKGQGYTSTLTNEDEELTIKASYEALVQFSFCGSTAPNMAHSFHSALNSIIVNDEYRRDKLGIMRKSKIRRAPQKRETEWIDYFNIDVTFSYELIEHQVVDVIEVVIIEENIDDVVTVYTVPPDIVITP